MNRHLLCKGSREPGSFQAATSSLETTEAAKKYSVWLGLGVGRKRGEVFTVPRQNFSKAQVSEPEGMGSQGFRGIGSGQE